MNGLQSGSTLQSGKSIQSGNTPEGSPPSAPREIPYEISMLRSDLLSLESWVDDLREKVAPTIGAIPSPADVQDGIPFVEPASVMAQNIVALRVLVRNMTHSLSVLCNTIEL